MPGNDVGSKMPVLPYEHLEFGEVRLEGLQQGLGDQAGFRKESDAGMIIELVKLLLAGLGKEEDVTLKKLALGENDVSAPCLRDEKGVVALLDLLDSFTGCAHIDVSLSIETSLIE